MSSWHRHVSFELAKWFFGMDLHLLTRTQIAVVGAIGLLAQYQRSGICRQYPRPATQGELAGGEGQSKVGR